MSYMDDACAIRTRGLLERLVVGPFGHITVNRKKFGMASHDEFTKRTFFSDRVSDNSKARVKFAFDDRTVDELRKVYEAGLSRGSSFNEVSASFAFAEIAAELGLPTDGMRFSSDDDDDRRAAKTALIVQEVTFIARYSRGKDSIDPDGLSKSYRDAFPVAAVEPGDTGDSVRPKPREVAFPDDKRSLIADTTLGVELGWSLAELGLLWIPNMGEPPAFFVQLQADVRSYVLTDGLMGIKESSFDGLRASILGFYEDHAPKKHVSVLAGMATRYVSRSLDENSEMWHEELIGLAKGCCLEMPSDLVDGAEFFDRLMSRLLSDGPGREWRAKERAVDLLKQVLHEDLSPAESNSRLASFFASSMLDVIDGSSGARKALESADELVAGYDVSLLNDADDIREVARLAGLYRMELEDADRHVDDWHDQADVTELELARLAFVIEEKCRGCRLEDREDCLDTRLVTLYAESRPEVREALVSAFLLDPPMPEAERRLHLGRSMVTMKALYAFEPDPALRRAIREGYDVCFTKLIDPDEWSDL